MAVTLPVTAATNTAAALSLGALLLDIDEPHFWIGRWMGPSFWALNRLVGHRGMTYSLIGWGVITLLAGLMIYLAPGPQIWAVYFSVGYLLHLVEDSFSKSGVLWLLPWSKRLYHSGLGVIE